MSERRDYTDAYCTEFEAQITALTDVNGRLAVDLDQTYFYPTSGGQPNDTGWLDGYSVVDVVADNGTVLHLLDDRPSFAVGGMIHGKLDWPRRYDHMQQHSGQHLLSQVFYRLFGVETISVHFGAEESTFDLDVEELTPAQIDEAERHANELAYTALPIRAYFVDESELEKFPLRRPPKVTGKIRIVEIAEYDYSACGGTHVHTTAEITPVKLLRQERRRGSVRLSFKCGRRAYLDYANRYQLLGATANLFSNDVGAVPELAARLFDQNRALQREVDDLTERLIAYEVEELLASAIGVGAAQVVCRFFPERSADALKTTAALLRARPDTIVLLAGSTGNKLTLVFGRSDELTPHMGNILRATLNAFGGGGGGRSEFAQGGGVDADQAQDLLNHALDLLRQDLASPSV